MAGKSKIDKAVETGDWSQLEKDARKALRKAGSALGHAQDDPDAEVELEPAESESESFVEDVSDPDDPEPELDDPEEPEESQDVPDDVEEDAPEKASISPPEWPRNFVPTTRYSSTSDYYLAGRKAAQEQERLERFFAFGLRLGQKRTMRHGAFAKRRCSDLLKIG